VHTSIPTTSKLIATALLSVTVLSGCSTVKFQGNSVQCLEGRRAVNAILDESTEPYYSQLQRREIATLTGEPATAETLAGCQDQARAPVAEGMQQFTREERDALTWASQELWHLLRNDYPVFAKQSWRFLKSDNRLCGGWSYTRGRCIILSERTLERIVKQHREFEGKEALRRIAPLLIHEQMHVIQRLNPDLFTPLYTGVLGLIQGDIVPNEWITTNQISNPDGIRNEWIIPLPSTESPEHYYWRRTILKNGNDVPKMGRDFKEVVVELKRKGNRFEVVETDGKPILHEQSQTVSKWDDRLPSKHGVDHPNEIAAYMFSNLISDDFLKEKKPDDKESTHPIAKQFKEWCQMSL